MKYKIEVKDRNGDVVYTCEGDRQLVMHLQAISKSVEYTPLEQLLKWTVKGAKGSFNLIMSSNKDCWNWYVDNFGTFPHAIIRR